MLSIFSIFILELIAFRWGSAKLASIGMAADPHGHVGGGGHTAHGPEGSPNLGGKSDEEAASWKDEKVVTKRDVDSTDTINISVVDSPLTQIIGVMILEFGVLLHRCAIFPRLCYRCDLADECAVFLSALPSL